MSRVISLILLAVLSCWANGGVGDQNSMKLNQLLLLVRDSKVVQMAEFERQMTLFKYEETKALDYGTVDLQMQGVNTNHSGAVFAMKLNEREVKLADFAPNSLNYPDSRDSFGTKLAFKLPLYTGGKISAYKEITKRLIDIAELDKRDLILQKSFEVKKGFYSIILLEQLITQINEIKSNTLFLKSSVKQMREEGYATKTDMLLLDARVAEIDSLINQLKTNKELILHFLSFLTSSKVGDISYDKGSVGVVFEDALDSDIITKNIGIQKAKTAIEIKKHQIEIASSQFLPDVGLMGEYGSNDERFLDNFSDHDYYMVGLGVSLNIFSGGASTNKEQYEKIDMMKQKKRLSYAKEGLLLQADDIRTKIKNLNFKLQALVKQKRYKKEILESFKESHREKRASMNDVLIHQSNFIQTVMKIQENQNLKYSEIFKFQTLKEEN